MIRNTTIKENALSNAKQHKNKNISFILYFLLFIVLLSGGLFRAYIFEHQSAISGTQDESAALLFSVDIYPPSLLTNLPKSCGVESNGLLFYCTTHYFIEYIPSLIISIVDTFYATKNPDDYASSMLINCLSSHEVQLLHFLPFCCSLTSMFLIYLIGKHIGNIKTGILSAFFCAISQTMLYSSSFLRFYQLNIFATCIASYFLILFINGKKYKILFGILYALSSMACVSSMMCSVFIFPAHILYLIFNNHPPKKFIPYIIWPFLLFIFLWFGDPLGLQRKEYYGTLDINIMSNIIANIFTFSSNTFIRNNYDKAFTLSIFLFPLAIISIYCLYLCKIKKTKPHFLNKTYKNSLLFASLWTVVPTILIFIFSTTYINIINTNNMSFIYPGGALLLGCIASYSKYLRWVMFTVYILLTSCKAPQPIAYKHLYLTDFLRAHATHNDIIGCKGEGANTLIASGIENFILYRFNLDSLEFFTKNNSSFIKKPHHLWLFYTDHDISNKEDVNSITDCLRTITKEGAVPKLQFDCGDNHLIYIRVPANIDT